jgi:hypothetical protein
MEQHCAMQEMQKGIHIKEAAAILAVRQHATLVVNDGLQTHPVMIHSSNKKITLQAIQ